MSHMETQIDLVMFAILGCVVIYSLLSKLIDRSVLTLPIIFVLVGYMVADPVKMLGTHDELRTYARYLAEITLILVLFSDASNVRLAKLKENYKIPLRMLVLGMPLTIFFGTLTVWMIAPAGGFAMALLTAAVLSPTDAAIGQSVVTNPNVPNRLSQSINVESGLNDGETLPFVLLGAALAAASMSDNATDGLAMSALIQIVLGPVVGIIVGWAAARGLGLAQDREWVLESAQGVVFIASAFACYLGAELIGGNGFVAAFVGGATFGNAYRHSLHFVTEFMEGNGQILTMAAFLVFGATMLPDAFAHVSFMPVLIADYARLVMRMLPIWIPIALSCCLAMCWSLRMVVGIPVIRKVMASGSWRRTRLLSPSGWVAAMFVQPSGRVTCPTTT